MNFSDSERIAGILETAGYEKTEALAKADVIVVTMCSIRQSAVDRIHSLVEKFNKIKQARKLQTTRYPLQTVLTGCVLKRDKNIFTSGFDHVIDIKNIGQLPQILKNKTTANSSQLCHDKDTKYLDIAPKHESKFTATVPIMTGCNNFCAYCVVPYTREREISRPAENIIKEVKNLVNNGYKEIWLLGQNVNSYRSQINANKNARIFANKISENSCVISFAKLLTLINQIPGEFWVRYTSSHPKDFKQDVIIAMAEGNHISPYLNLPVQSGDNKVLKSMNRHYTVAQYKEKIKQLRKAIPNICLSTDIIVGFPGETKKQFENTVKLFKEIKYDMAYINKYSKRSGTLAYKLDDKILADEKKCREKTLNDVLRKTALANNKKYVGKELLVLIDSKKDNKYFSRTNTYKLVEVTSNKKGLVGNFIKVKITKANPWRLEAKIIN